MGCGGSKEDDLPLVIRCRERKELIKAAADHRYALAAAHITYFRSLVGVGDALRHFIDEELLIPSPSASTVLTLPSNEGKTKKKNKSKSINKDPQIAETNSSSSISLDSDSGSHIHLADDDHDHDHDHDGEGSHLHLSSSSNSEFSSSGGHIHLHDSPHHQDEGPSHSSPPSQTGRRQYGSNPPPGMGWEPYGAYPMNPPPQSDWDQYATQEPYGVYPPSQSGWNSYPMNPPPQSDWDQYATQEPYGVYPPSQPGWNSYPMNPPPQSDWDQYGTQPTSYTYYMKKSSPQIHSVIYDPTTSSTSWQVPETSNSYVNSYPNNQYGNGGYYGYPMQPPSHGVQNHLPPRPANPPPPPSPKASAWDFLDPFDGHDSNYPSYNYGAYENGSISSSPDSAEVREREGIPDLEDETESEVYRETRVGKNMNEDKINKNIGEGSNAPLNQQSSEESSKAVPSQNSGSSSKEVPSEISEVAYSVDVKEKNNSPDTIATKKGVTFEVETIPVHDVESSRFSSFTTLSASGTRDLQEVVAEIRDEFVTASDYGKEVALLLEVGKVPHQPKFALLRVILSRIMYMVAPNSPHSHPPSRQPIRYSHGTMKLAKAYYEESVESGMKPGNLSSTLEKLYIWEKKLYKEVKDEERLRVIYEKHCERLKVLDECGAESSKIDATQASIKKLLTKLNVCIRAVDAISRRIHKLRDEELQPQVSELIYGLIRMWRSMLKCHQKQFQVIMESKARSMRTNANSRGGSSLKATLELEVELRTWCGHFSNWITTQKSFVESLNGWLMSCIYYEPENTPDGPIPYSPCRIGAPQTFVICKDWSQGMKRISETKVARAMKNFALSLENLLENQGEEQRQRLKAEYLSKDFERRLRILRMERGKIDISDSGSLVASDHSGISPIDDLKVDLDSIKSKWSQERVHGTGSSSIQSGLIPIFEALGRFTSEALKAYEHVRIRNDEQYHDGN